MRLLQFLLVTILVVGIIAAQPAAAQEATNPVCQDESGVLTQALEGYVQLVTAFAVMGLFVVWQGESLAEMFTLNPERLMKLKQHKRQSLKSTVIILLLGAGFTLAGKVMGVPVARCIDLTPF